MLRLRGRRGAATALCARLTARADTICQCCQRPYSLLDVCVAGNGGRERSGHGASRVPSEIAIVRGGQIRRCCVCAVAPCLTMTMPSLSTTSASQLAVVPEPRASHDEAEGCGPPPPPLLLIIHLTLMNWHKLVTQSIGCYVTPRRRKTYLTDTYPKRHVPHL